MSALNWGMIESGGTFESLVYTLLYDKDPSVILFGRPGKDSGQDARSKDGTCVYQAKFRNTMTMSIAIDLAKKELKKIVEYRKQSHPNSKHWAHVTQWILVANITHNPNNEAAWQRDVIPAFSKIGITAEYWSLEKLEPEIISRPHLQDVFFNGNNRTLVCAREAFDLLSKISPGPSFLNTDLVGRQTSLKEVESFLDSPTSSILVVAGVHGIGKTRFLYDSMLAANEKEWRVLWGHTASMKASSDWFRLLNSSSKTCVCIDGVDNRDFFKRILEQATTSERRNWKFILTIQPEHESILREFSGIKRVELKNLSEPESRQLATDCLGKDHPMIQNRKAFHLYSLTQGLPAWQCMILEECKIKPNFVLPEKFPDFVRHIIDSSLASIPSDLLRSARIMLRWFAAWDVVKIEDSNPKEFKFLSENGIPQDQMEDTLSELVKCRLISVWGIGKRSHAVEPAIIRQQILSDWLLEPTESTRQYRTTRTGLSFVRKLLRFQVPNTPVVLQNLCRMAVSYLPDQDSKQFLRPIFDGLEAIAEEGSLKDQYDVLELLKRIGHTDPDASLDILLPLRQCVLPNETVAYGTLDKTTLSHDAMLSSVCEYLFMVAREVPSVASAKRFLSEIKVYLDFEMASSVRFLNGQEPSKCLQRLLGHPRCAHQYTPQAVDELRENWESLPESLFLRTVLKTIWDPYRETITGVDRRFCIQRYHIANTNHPVWKLCLEFREKAFATLRDRRAGKSLRRELWSQLHFSVARFDETRSMFNDNHPAAELMLDRLQKDLETINEIVSGLREPLDLEELAEARNVWAPFLNEYAPETLSSPAKRCDSHFQAIFKWPVQAMFSSDAWTNESPIEQIACRLKQENDVSSWRSFFNVAEQYLRAYDSGDPNANLGHVDTLVEKFCDGTTLALGTPVMVFASEILRHSTPSALERVFAIALGRRFVLQAKTNQSQFSAEKCLEPFLEGCPWKAEVLVAVYSYPHPKTVGTLTTSEFRFLADPIQGFSSLQQAFVLASFFEICPTDTKQALSSILNKSAPFSDERNELARTIAESVYMAGLRYDWPPDHIPIDWIMEMIVGLKIDPRILDRQSLLWMIDQTGWKFSMVQFVRFVQSCIEQDSKRSQHSNYSGFPHGFSADRWCRIGTEKEEQEAYNKFCEIIMEGGRYTTVFECPEMLPKIDADGTCISKFAARYFSVNPNPDRDSLYRLAGLVAHYEEGSLGWRAIAKEVCKRAATMSKNDESKIFRGFLPRRVLTNWQIGLVPKEVEKAVEEKRLRCEREPAGSSLKGYFEWALDIAEKSLNFERQRAEEELREDF